MENKEIIETPQEITSHGMTALAQLRQLVTGRPDKLVINGKQYLYFYDWQILGRFFGITPQVESVEPITENEPINVNDSRFYKVVTVGYKARATARKNGEIVSAAEAICLKNEPNWKGKQDSFLYSMAQTRASAKALRNCLEWVIKLPGKQQEIPFAEDIAEEL